VKKFSLRRAKTLSDGGSKTASFLRILVRAWQDFRAHWKILLWISGVVTVPVSILQVVPTLSTNQLLQAYLAIASMIMSVALLWAVMELAAGRPVTLRRAYYDGTTAFVKFLIVFTVLTLQMLPLVFGATIYAVGIQAASTTPEEIIFGLVWVLLSLPSLYWLNRNIYAMFHIFEPDSTPVAALRASRREVKGQFWAAFARLIGLVAMLIVVLLALLTLVGLVVHNQALLLATVQLLANLLALPLFYLALYHLHRALLDR
jgi:hypothetical protein